MEQTASTRLKELVSRRILELRHQRSMTQTELADLVGTGKPHISELEHGKTSPGIGLLAKLAEALQVEPADLLREGDAKPSRRRERE